MNHFCNSKVKHHICLKYTGKEKTACLLYLAKGVKDAIDGGNQNRPNHPLMPYLYTEYGNFLFEAGDYRDAIPAYMEALRKNRNYLPGYVKLADAFIKIQAYEQAEKSLQRALQLAKKPSHKAYFQRRLEKLAKLKVQ